MFAFGVLFLGILVGGVAPAPQAAQASTPPAFTCEPGFYQVLSGALFRLNFATGQYDAIGPNPGLGNYNALGYNTEDNLLYATRNSDSNDPGGSSILKIFGDGSVEILGKANLPLSNPSWFGGDFDGAGNLYVVNTVGVWAKVDVSAMTSQTLTLTGGSPALPDFSIINGVAYGIDNGSNTLIRVDLTTLQVTSTSVSGLPSATYGATFVSNSTRLYVARNDTGVVYEISNYASGTATASTFTTATTTSSNDGAACPSAGNPSGGFQVSFSLGGGTGTTPSTLLDKVTGTVSTLPGGSGFSRTGFDFGGWSCDNGIGTVAGGGSLTQPAADVECTAIWTASAPTTYTVSYNLGGGSGTTPSDITNLSAGDTPTLASGSGFSRTGFDFGGWSCDNGIGTVAGGGSLTQPAADVECTALWNPVTGGTGSAPPSASSSPSTPAGSLALTGVRAVGLGLSATVILILLGSVALLRARLAVRALSAD
jgi:hypothetical protein